MSLIDLVASVFGVLSVWYSIRRSIWAWPTGLVQVVLLIFTFHQSRLYSDMMLQIIYVPLQLYGWWHWLYGDKTRPELPITRLSAAAAVGWVVAAIAMTAIDGYVMKRYFNADFPYLDGAIAVFSLVATYLLARKVLDNWPIWIGVDILALYVYPMKGLYVVAGLYALFLVMAIGGFYEWTRAYKSQRTQSPAREPAPV
jgi:nicotinamide mononucleotide transporter